MLMSRRAGRALKAAWKQGNQITRQMMMGDELPPGPPVWWATIPTPKNTYFADGGSLDVTPYVKDTGTAITSYAMSPQPAGFTISAAGLIEVAPGTAIDAHSFTVTATNALGTSGPSNAITWNVLADIPVISNVQSTPTPDGAVITWDTVVASDSLVEWGTSPGNYNLTQSYSAGPTQAHSETLTGGDADTPYYYRITSETAAGATESTVESTFTTEAGVAPVWIKDIPTPQTVATGYTLPLDDGTHVDSDTPLDTWESI